MSVDRKRKHETCFRPKTKLTENRKSVILGTENEDEFRSVCTIHSSNLPPWAFVILCAASKMTYIVSGGGVKLYSLTRLK